MTAEADTPARRRESPHGSPVRRALVGILLFQLGLAVILALSDVGRDFALPSRGPEAPRFERPTAPGDQTRRYDPADLPATRPAAPGGQPGTPRPDRLVIEGAGTEITLTGTIAPGDADRIAPRLAEIAPDVVLLDSPGGSVLDALALGRALRRAGIETEVRDGAICLSACPWLFAGGTERRAHPGARIGVHQHYFGENTLLPAFTAVSDIQRGLGIVMRYLDEMGVDARLMEHGLVTPPDAIYLLEPDELTDYRLATELLGD